MALDFLPNNDIRRLLSSFGPLHPPLETRNGEYVQETPTNRLPRYILIGRSDCFASRPHIGRWNDFRLGFSNLYRSVGSREPICGGVRLGAMEIGEIAYSAL